MGTQSNAIKEALLQVETLQGANKRLAQIKRDQQALDLDVLNQERLVQEKKHRAEEAHNQRLEAAKTADSTQMQIEEAEVEIAKFKVQMNTARQQKELDAIQHTLLSRRADIQRWEELGLRALEQADELTAQEEALLRESESAEQDLVRIRREVADRKGEYAGLIEEMEGERESIRQQIRPVVLSAYERLASHHHGQPLARVRGRTCRGCFTRVTKQTENRLMHGVDIVYCHSCGRILMLDEG